MVEQRSSIPLMSSLGHLVRGLTAVFWGLPITLLVSAQTDIFNWFKPFGGILPVLGNGVLMLGLWHLGHFQAQERVWTRAVNRAKLITLVNLGLSPFLFFWYKIPQNPFFFQWVIGLIFFEVFFLFLLNRVVFRLSTMIPDQTLREETCLFTRLNCTLLVIVMASLVGYLILRDWQATLSPQWLRLLKTFDQIRHLFVIVLVLLPVAMTMTLVWKIREAVFHSVFQGDGPPQWPQDQSFPPLSP